MTNQEAIERLQEAYYILCEDDYFLNPMREAFDMAISALQAQDSKTRRICDTCKYNQPSKKWPCVDCDMREHADRWEPQDVPDINVGDMKTQLPAEGTTKLATNLQLTCNNLATDTISRQATIDALDKRFDSVPMEQTAEILMLRKDLRELPSAQPEIIRCRDCKHSEHWYSDKGRCFLWHEEGIDVFEDGFCNYAERKTDRPQERDTLIVATRKAFSTLEAKKRREAICSVAGVNDIGEVSDGFHTFNSLYEQRMILFAALVKAYKNKSWKSYRHEDDEYCFGGGWFIVGIDTPEGSYTYHYEDNYFSLFDCEELERGKHWDGHTEKDVTRLLSLPSAQPEPCEDKLKEIADALSEKMCYMNTCPNEKDIILSYLGRKRSSKNHCNTDCLNEKCESYHYETKQQPEPCEDAVSRKELLKFFSNNSEGSWTYDTVAIGYIKALPSVMLKPDHIGDATEMVEYDDCVSRQAVVDVAYEVGNLFDGEDDTRTPYGVAFDIQMAVDKLPSVTPKPEPCEDAVSRKSILDKIKEVCFSRKQEWVDFRVSQGSNGQRDLIIKFIESLQSIQPRPSISENLNKCLDKEEE